MKILAVANGEPEAVSTWSGITSYAVRALRDQDHEVVSYDGTKPRNPSAIKMVDKVRRQMGFAGANVAADIFASKRLLDYFRALQADLIIGFAVSTEIGLLKARAPFIHVADATPAVLFDYYPEYTALAPKLRTNADIAEERVLRYAAMSALASPWAADSALEDYGAPPSTLAVNPFGACIQDPGRSLNSPARKCSFLWCGVAWEREGAI